MPLPTEQTDRTCEKTVEGPGVASWTCSVKLKPDGSPHDGPCATPESPRSMNDRKVYEEGVRERAAAREADQRAATAAATQAAQQRLDAAAGAVAGAPATEMSPEEAQAILGASQGPPQNFYAAQGEPEKATVHPGVVNAPVPEGTVATRPQVVTDHPMVVEPPPMMPVEMIEETTCPKCGADNSSTPRVSLSVSVGVVTGIPCQRCAHFFVPGSTMRVINPAVPDPETEPEPVADLDISKVVPEPTKQREGDQPLPKTNGHPYIADLLVADIEKRRQVGIERYGTPLQPFNGRKATLDAFEEALDLTTYLRQLMYEMDITAGAINELADDIERKGIDPALVPDLLRSFANNINPHRS